MLSVKDLTISYTGKGGPVTIAEGIEFDLDKGEALGIVGESGSGKTLSALSLLQLLPHGIEITSGKILYTGERGTGDLAFPGHMKPEHIRGRGMAMIFQEPMSCLNPTMKCGDQVSEAVRLHTARDRKTAFDKTLDLFREVGLPGTRTFYQKYPHQLSGGQRQRVMIAMALAGDPEILLADEPTTALDVTVQKKILELLKQIQRKRKMSLIFISHDLGVVRSVCERALVMYQGRIVESGRTNEIFKHPSHPYTRGLLACRPQLATNRTRLPVLDDFLGDGPDDHPDRPGSQQTLMDGSLAGRNAGRVLMEVRELTVSYMLRRNWLGNTRDSLMAVNRVSFDILEGETLGLIGESGCGKSTLGKSLIRLIGAGEGDITFMGRNVLALKGRQLNEYRRKVQFVFQDPYSSLNPGIRIGKVLAEAMRVHGLHGGKRQRDQAARDLLSKVGLSPGHFERHPHEFSGGQRQRIGIARALATGPMLIICDESVSSLDVSVQAQILNLLNDLKEELGLTYLFISHDLAVVRYMSDRILVMKDGELVETGSAEGIFHHPKTEYTRKFIAAIPE